MDLSARNSGSISQGWVKMLRCRRGASLLYLVAAIAVVGAVGVGVAQFFPRTLQSKITEDRAKRAYYLALSGQNFWPTVQTGMVDGTEYTYTIGNDKILLKQVVDASGNYTVTSQGVCDANTEFEANYKIEIADRSSGAGGSNNDFSGDVLNSPLDRIVKDEATGQYVVDDISPNTNPGIVKGKVSGAVTSVAGIIDNAVHFDCSNYGRIVYAGIDAYNIFYSGSISLWFNANNFDNQNAGLLHKGESDVACQSSDSSVLIFSDEVYTFQFTPGSSTGKVRLRFVIIDGAQNTSCSATDTRCLCRGSRAWQAVSINSNTQFNNKTASSTGDTNKWYYVVATWSYDDTVKKTTLKLYVNGALDKTVIAQPFTPRRNSAPIVLGSQQDADTNAYGSVFCGTIDDVNVFSSPLAADKIKKYYCKYVSSDSICN